MTRTDEMPGGRWTRGRLLRTAIGGGAVVAGGAATASWTGGAPAAAPSAGSDVEILNHFLLLEQVQQGFYAEALEAGRLSGGLRSFAGTVSQQEREHVALLTKRLGNRARDRPRTDFGEALTDPARFREAAIELEEATISAYIAQGANLTREAVAAIVPLVSVEARQVAWIRDLAGVSPAPRAADPPAGAGDVVRKLRAKGWIR